MSKIKYFLVAAVFAAAAIVPMVVSSSIDKKIEENKVLLEKNGFKQEILEKSGYLNSTRNFSLEVVDTQKARDFLLDKLVEKNAQYKIFAQSLRQGMQDGDNQIMNGLTFKGVMVNSNLLPSDTKVSLVLDKFPTVLQNELQSDKEIADAFLPLLAKGVFALDMTFGSSDKLVDMKLKELKVRNIKENIKVKDVVLDVDALNQSLTLNTNNGLVNGALLIGKQDFSIASELFLLKSNLRNLKYDFEYKDDFNNKSDFESGRYAFEMVEAYSDVKFSFESMKAFSSVADSNNNLQIKGDYTLNSIVYLSHIDELKLDKLFLKLDLKDIESATMKKLQEDYRKLALGEEEISDQVLIDDFVKFINYGVKLDLGVAFQGLSGEFNLKDISIDTTVEIPKNKYTDKQSPLAILNLLDISAKVKMHKDDKQTLESLSIATAEDFAYGRPEGDFFIYDVAMKNGAISVNGKKVQ